MKKVISICVAASAGFVFAADPIKVLPPQQKTLQSENGRFVFGQISDWRSDQYMLDTQTGRLWLIGTTQTKGADGKPTGGEFRALQPVPYSAMDDTLSVYPK